MSQPSLYGFNGPEPTAAPDRAANPGGEVEGSSHRVEELELDLPSGRVHAVRWGAGGPTVVCLPGLSANLHGFDAIAGRLAAHGFQVVVLDLRGRGKSETTPPGTYGWPAHAADVADVARSLGAGPITLVGWSMGAFVALEVASTEPLLLSSVVLMDACAPTSEQANALIRLAVDRLGAVYPSVGQYLELIRQMGTITPWDPLWERYFEYELEPVEGGVRARTSRSAVAEDFEYGATHDARDRWSTLSMPALLVRAARPLVPGGPFIVTDADRDAFADAVPHATVVEVDANHYGMVTHPGTADSIVAFLGRQAP
jgi:pimeloyl-ACP methyl ester carboxylesterase